MDVHRLSRQTCSFACRCKHKGQSLEGRVLDLSFDIALIAQLSPPPRLGTRVVLDLDCAGDQLRLEGKVVYRQSRRTGPWGVEFCGCAEDNLRRLSPVLERLSSGQPERGSHRPLQNPGVQSPGEGDVESVLVSTPTK